MTTYQPETVAGFYAMTEVDAMRIKLEQWRQRTGRKAMRRFSYVAEYCPSDLSEKLITPSITNDGSKSAVKRKPLSCLNLSPNQIKEQIPNQLNIKLRFDDDFVATTTDGGTEKQFEDLEDDEITINPARRKRCRSLNAEANIVFTSTTIRYTTSIPRNRSKDNEGILVTPVKRSTRQRSASIPGYLIDQRSLYNSPSEINTSQTVVVLPNDYL